MSCSSPTSRGLKPIARRRLQSRSDSRPGQQQQQQRRRVRRRRPCATPAAASPRSTRRCGPGREARAHRSQPAPERRATPAARRMAAPLQADRRSAPAATCIDVDGSRQPAEHHSDDLIGTTLDSLAISIDGGADAPIPNSDISLPLPQPGAVSVNYTTSADGLAPGDHTICVTADRLRRPRRNGERHAVRDHPPAAALGDAARSRPTSWASTIRTPSRPHCRRRRTSRADAR